jgi:hypothetical protein
MTRFDPAKAEAARRAREKAAGSFEIPWGLIFGGIVILLIVGAIGAFLMGPKKVWNEWEDLGPKASADVIDVVSRGLQGYLFANGMWDPGLPHAGKPSAHEDVIFYRPGFVMSMPETVNFKGVSDAGAYSGMYHTKTGEVEVDLQLEMLATGKGPTRKVPTVKLTGRVRDGRVTVEADGKTIDPYPKSRLKPKE